MVVKNSKVYYLIILFIFILSAACSKGNNFDVVPTLNFVSSSIDTVLEAAPFTVLTFEFTDGDNDIGFVEGEPEAKIIVMDQRDEINNRPDFRQEYKILLDVLQLGSITGVSGEIMLDFNDFYCLDSALAIDSTRLEAYLVDRAGNQSNTTITDWIYIDCI